MWRIIILLSLLNFGPVAAEEALFLSLPDSRVILEVPEGWTIKRERDEFGEAGISPPTPPGTKRPPLMHMVRSHGSETTLEEALHGEIDRITQNSSNRGSSNDRSRYKGNVSIQTRSGMEGVRADFYLEGGETPRGVRHHGIVKYYFFDESGKIFKVCAHVDGDDARLKLFENVIVEGLKVSED